MSVTFYADPAPIVGYRLEDPCGGASVTVGTYADAEALQSAMAIAGDQLPGCADPEWMNGAGQGPYICPVTADLGEDPTMNVNNSNAGRLLRLLGIDPERLAGSMDATTFLGAVLLAQALDRAPAALAVLAPSQWSRDQYETERLAELSALSQWCRDRGRAVCWA